MGLNRQSVASYPKDQKAAGLSVSYSFPCPGCGEFIALPAQSRLGWAGSSQFLATALWPVPFLCNRHLSIAEVPSSAVRLATNLVVGQRHRADPIVVIEGDCCLENCGKRHAVYTHYPSGTNQNSILQAFLSCNPYISCLGGHSAKFHRDRLAVRRLTTA
ncbi:MAG: hypothetical protein ACRD3S_03030 [Terracidiphilus sp.]